MNIMGLSLLALGVFLAVLFVCLRPKGAVKLFTLLATEENVFYRPVALPSPIILQPAIYKTEPHLSLGEWDNQ